MTKTKKQCFSCCFFFQGQSRPLFGFIFVLFSFRQQYSYNFNNVNWIDGVLGPQDCRRRRYHGAMATVLWRLWSLVWFPSEDIILTTSLSSLTASLSWNDDLGIRTELVRAAIRPYYEIIPAVIWNPINLSGEQTRNAKDRCCKTFFAGLCENIKVGYS